MAGLTNFAEAILHNYVFGRSAAASFPNTWDFALFTSMPNEDGTGGEEVSTSGTGYARKSVSNNTTNFPLTPTTTAGDDVKGVKVQAVAIQFAAVTANWGRVVGWGIYDASGNLWAYGELPEPREYITGDTPKFAAEALTFTFEAQGGAAASPLSFFLRKQLLDALFGRGDTYVIPSTLYFALMTAMPAGVDAAGTELTIGSNGYARVPVANSTTNFGSYTDGEGKNLTQITWPTVATAAWADVLGMAIYDAATSGQLLFEIPFSTRTYAVGEVPRIPVADFVHFLD